MIPFLIHSPLCWIWFFEPFQQHINSWPIIPLIGFPVSNIFFAWSAIAIPEDISFFSFSIFLICSFLTGILAAQNTSLNVKCGILLLHNELCASRHFWYFGTVTPTFSMFCFLFIHACNMFPSNTWTAKRLEAKCLYLAFLSLQFTFHPQTCIANLMTNFSWLVQACVGGIASTVSQHFKFFSLWNVKEHASWYLSIPVSESFPPNSMRLLI